MLRFLGSKPAGEGLLKVKIQKIPTFAAAPLLLFKDGFINYQHKLSVD